MKRETVEEYIARGGRVRRCASSDASKETVTAQLKGDPLFGSPLSQIGAEVFSPRYGGSFRVPRRSTSWPAREHQ